MSKGLDDSAELDEGARFHSFDAALKPWAILHHHPLGTEIAQQSVTPGFRRSA